MLILWNVMLAGLAESKISSKDIRNAFQKTKQGISRYMTDVFDNRGDMTSDFDDFTRYGSKLEPMGNGGVSKIREKLYPDVLKLFKKLNIRALFNEMGPMEDTVFNEGHYGLFADAIKDYGCWCLPNQGLEGHGAPVDDIDRICHEFNTCLTCLEYDSCNVEETVYEWQIVKDDKSAKKNIFCSDSSRSCHRNLCHCEVNLAQQIMDIAHTYNPVYAHANGFDRTKHCGKHALPLFTTTVATTTTTTSTTTTTTSTTTTTTTLVRTSAMRTSIDFLVDEYEAEDDDTRGISVDALEKILVADYPEDPLLSTGFPAFDIIETTKTTTAQTTTTTEMNELPSKINFQTNLNAYPVRSIPVRLEAPVMLKSAKSGYAPKLPYVRSLVNIKPSPPQCCGDYPNVHIFNPDRRKCCDGMIRSIGSC